jgi:hypothetical protein
MHFVGQHASLGGSLGASEPRGAAGRRGGKLTAAAAMAGGAAGWRAEGE